MILGLFCFGPFDTFVVFTFNHVTWSSSVNYLSTCAPRPALGVCPPPTSLYYSFLCCSLAHYLWGRSVILFSGISVRLKRLLKVWMRTLCVVVVLSEAAVLREKQKWKVQQRKSKLHFWLVCSVVVVGIGHYLITAFYNQSPFSFCPGMVSFPEAPPPLVLRHSASLSSSSRSAVRCLALESETGLCLRQVNCLWDSCANGANPTFVELVLSVWAC